MKINEVRGTYVSHYIVMQNASHSEEISGGYMWSPQKIKVEIVIMLMNAWLQ